MLTLPSAARVRRTWRDLARDEGHTRDVWIYGRALAGFTSDEIAAQLNRGWRWPPARASHWTPWLVRERIRLIRRELRRRLGLPDPRGYSGKSMSPEQAREHRRMYRALRSETGKLDLMLIAAGVVR